MSEMMDNEILKIVEKELDYQREKKKKEMHEMVPDMQKELKHKNMKIMVKYSNINYDSVEDVFETRRGDQQTVKKRQDVSKKST